MRQPVALLLLACLQVALCPSLLPLPLHLCLCLCLRLTRQPLLRCALLCLCLLHLLSQLQPSARRPRQPLTTP